MIIGIGTDLVSIERIRTSISEYGQRFLDRCFTSLEQEKAKVYTQEEKRSAYLAKRWAAKEACSKAFGTGIGKTIGFQDIDVSTQSKEGQPLILVTGGAAQYLDDMYPNQKIKIDISLSDEKDFALAFVVISVE